MTLLDSDQPKGDHANKYSRLPARVSEDNVSWNGKGQHRPSAINELRIEQHGQLGVVNCQHH
jgi:hypothetical protein